MCICKINILKILFNKNLIKYVIWLLSFGIINVILKLLIIKRENV